jgi:hypothetical protein
MQTRRLSDSPPGSTQGADSPASVSNLPVADRSVWTSEDETALIQFLNSRRAEAGDGANFKQTVWNAAAAEMAKHTTKGGVKTAAACKSKWTRV